jgi:hypothetical protein
MPMPKEISPAGVDLGLDLQAQLETEEEKRKRLKMAANNPGAFGDLTLGNTAPSAALSLGIGGGL